MNSEEFDLMPEKLVSSHCIHIAVGVYSLIISPDIPLYICHVSISYMAVSVCVVIFTEL